MNLPHPRIGFRRWFDESYPEVLYTPSERRRYAICEAICWPFRRVAIAVLEPFAKD